MHGRRTCIRALSALLIMATLGLSLGCERDALAANLRGNLSSFVIGVFSGIVRTSIGQQ